MMEQKRNPICKQDSFTKKNEIPSENQIRSQECYQMGCRIKQTLKFGRVFVAPKSDWWLFRYLRSEFEPKS